MRQESSGITHVRDERHERQEGPARVVFVLHDGGPGRYLHEGRAHRLDRGGLHVTDLNSQYSYSRPGDGVARIVQVERSRLEMSMEQVQEASTRLYASPLYTLLVASRSGFSNASHFSRRFRGLFGISPHEARGPEPTL